MIIDTPRGRSAGSARRFVALAASAFLLATATHLEAVRAATVSVAAPGAAPSPPPPVPSFGAEVNWVEVDAVVTDKDGQPVRDLAAGDFELLEDGKPQSIVGFNKVDIPVEREDAPSTARAHVPTPDVRSNARPFDGRVYAMVIDDAHTRFDRTGHVKRAARQFIEQRLGANDLMAVVHTTGPRDANQEFTNEKPLLLAAVDRTTGHKLTSATVQKADHYQQTRGIPQSGDTTRIADPADAERGFAAHATLQTLKAIADWFGSVRGRRKSILFVSEGIDYDVTNVFDNPSASTINEDTRELIAAAARGNVSIYGIDPRGLTSLADEEIEVGSYPADTSLGIGHTSLLEELRLSQDSLSVLSSNTGGFAVINQNDFQTAYARIVRENSAYYMLAYDPPAGRRDGKFHRIEVKVVGRPGLTVQARKGYAAPRGRAPAAAKDRGPASAAVKNALDSPLPVSGLTLSVFAAPFRGQGGKASLLLGTEVRGRDLGLDGGGKLEISYVAVDTGGDIKGGNTETMTLALRPETRTQVEQSGLRLLSRLDLPPGRYQIRVAGQDHGNGRVGSVLTDVVVPDFDRAPLSVSGIALTSALASRMPSARVDEKLKGVLPGVPVAAREFVRGDQAVCYAEVYDNDHAPHTVDVTTTVTGLEDGAVAFRETEEHASTEFQGHGVGVTAKLPIPDLTPGDYVLEVEARSRRGNALAKRAIPFRVVASPQSR
jgi:VWFA-related protein